MGDAIYLGLDVGSLSTDAVVVDGAGVVLGSSVVLTGARAVAAAERARDEALARAGRTAEEVARTVATGYGRRLITFAQRRVTEISCHARGIRQVLPRTRTLIDLGGQDSKAIRLDDDGRVSDFAMNDKCAAGTGRFLEVMARTLEVPLEEMGARSLAASSAVEISSMCTVFAESEVVTRIAEGCEVEPLLAGIHRAIASRTLSLIRRVRPEPPYAMSGGVARNPAVVRALEELLREPIALPEEPQLVGALGAALTAAGA